MLISDHYNFKIFEDLVGVSLIKREYNGTECQAVSFNALNCLPLTRYFGKPAYITGIVCAMMCGDRFVAALIQQAATFSQAWFP
ncbi:hypothetical protein JCM39068_43430 [Desulfocastanea catecholica]